MIKSIISRACVAATAIFIGCGAALAQAVVVPPDETHELMQEAFETPFGRMMINEFNVKVGDGADRACLRDKNITIGEYFAQGEGFIRGWSVFVLGQFYTKVGHKTYEATVESVLGPNGKDKLQQVLAAPEVVRYREIERRVRLVEALYFALENLDRYVLIEDLNLRPVSPLSTAVPALLDASGVEKAVDELFAFQEANKTDALEQYVALATQARERLSAAMDQDGVRATDLFNMADQDLARLCVFHKTAK